MFNLERESLLMQNNVDVVLGFGSPLVVELRGWSVRVHVRDA